MFWFQLHHIVCVQHLNLRYLVSNLLSHSWVRKIESTRFESIEKLVMLSDALAALCSLQQLIQNLIQIIVRHNFQTNILDVLFTSNIWQYSYEIITPIDSSNHNLVSVTLIWAFLFFLPNVFYDIFIEYNVTIMGIRYFEVRLAFPVVMPWWLLNQNPESSS